MKAKDLALFVSGFSIGVIATYLIVKRKFQKDAEQEIEEVREFYKSRQKSDPSSKDFEGSAQPTQPNTINYATIIQALGYDGSHKKDPLEAIEAEPYLITPDEYGSDERYASISVTKFADGVIIEDGTLCTIDPNILGIENLTRFGDSDFGYEEGLIYIRNDMLKTEYEVSESMDTSGSFQNSTGYIIHNSEGCVESDQNNE